MGQTGAFHGRTIARPIGVAEGEQCAAPENNVGDDGCIHGRGPYEDNCDSLAFISPCAAARHAPDRLRPDHVSPGLSEPLVRRGSDSFPCPARPPGVDAMDRRRHPTAALLLHRSGMGALAGWSEWSLRFPSAWWVTLTTALMAALTLRLSASRSAAALAALLTALHPLLIYYGQEARMYAAHGVGRSGGLFACAPGHCVSVFLIRMDCICPGRGRRRLHTLFCRLSPRRPGARLHRRCACARRGVRR